MRLWCTPKFRRQRETDKKPAKKKKKKSEQKTRGETQDSGLSRRKALSIVSNVVD